MEKGRDGGPRPSKVGGGKNCCIPDCLNYWRKTREKALSATPVCYFSIPDRLKHESWHDQMVAAISRLDPHFKPATHKICSVHFEAKCFLFHDRAPPPVPHIVKYYTFEEMLGDVRKISEPWTVLRQRPNFLALGSIDSNLEVATKVIFEDNFVPIIKRYNHILYQQRSAEERGLVRLLNDLEGLIWCTELMATDCKVVVNTEGACNACMKMAITGSKQVTSAKRPLASFSKEALIKEVRTNRAVIKDKEARIAQISRKIQEESESVTATMQNDLQDIIEQKKEDYPFMKLFWDEQQKQMSRNPKGRRWHPMMIRFGIYLHYHSDRAYRALEDSGVLCLPSRSTLYNYTSAIGGQEGLQTHVFQSIRAQAQELPPERRFCILLFDEMYVRGDLIYNTRSDEIVGFRNPKTWTFTDKDMDTVASQVLAFMIVGINSTIKECIAFYSTSKNTKCDFLFRAMWRSIAHLESHDMKVVAVVSDKASCNQKLYRLHSNPTTNIYSVEQRPLFFISDVPHLLKTLRNNLESRPLWNNGEDILWDHIWDVMRAERKCEVRKTQLTDKHLYLTPASRMSVRLAVQVLSKRVGCVLQSLGETHSATATFVINANRFFDCLNGQTEWSSDSASEACNRDLLAYMDITDTRFEFLENFLTQLADWKLSVDHREGFEAPQKERMFLSSQTYEGIQTTVVGFIGATRYLLEHGVTSVKSNIFCQDPLENRFGRHRGLGGWSRNPSSEEFRRQETQLHLQRSLAMQFTPRGNVAGEKTKVLVSEEPLAKRKKTKPATISSQ